MKLILISLFILIQTSLFGQLKGIVYGSFEGKKEALVGAKVKLLNSKTGVITDKDGKFELILPKQLPDTMVITAIGFYTDTIIVDRSDRFISMEIIMYSDQLLPEVVVEHRRQTHSVSRLKTLHMEELTSGELRKAACCNLSESFETNASVDVNITDAVSGAKKIQMMGLDGVYTQIQMENIPYLRGLESSFGLNSISGTWIESIQITKGTGNVVNGYESMAGLVNIELKKPETMEAFYANAYANAFGRAELNFNGGIRLNSKWVTGWLAHASGMFGEMDNNKDGFRDIPKGGNLAFLNRWRYDGQKMEAQFGFNAYLDEKQGGQLIRFSTPSTARYIVEMQSRHIDAFAKTGFFTKKPYRTYGIVYNLKYQETDATFGFRRFEGTEYRGYINAIYDDIIGTTDHKIKAGISGVFIDLKQNMFNLNDDRREIVPGAFAEYTYTGMRLVGVLGVRGDYHNLFGFQFSPRVHSKYTLTEYTDLRFTAGKGWRTPNYMIDNVSLLASSHQWVSSGNVQPEISWNIGGSVVQQFKFGKRTGTFVFDFYHTYFENQLVVDRDQFTDRIVFNYLENTSFSNALQSELTLPLSKTVELRMAYKFLDVRSKFGELFQQQVMLPKHRGFVNIGYITRNKRWEFDLTGSVFGQARLPQVLLPDDTFSSDEFSEVYPIVNAQITHIYKRWDFYIGGENITNYKQKNAIIDAENPFGSYFDATRIWAPVMGINAYIGIRYSIKQKESKIN